MQEIFGIYSGLVKDGAKRSLGHFSWMVRNCSFIAWRSNSNPWSLSRLTISRYSKPDSLPMSDADRHVSSYFDSFFGGPALGYQTREIISKHHGPPRAAHVPKKTWNMVTT
jgi:hypothetical protein